MSLPTCRCLAPRLRGEFSNRPLNPAKMKRVLAGVGAVVPVVAAPLHQALLDQAAVLPDWQAVDRADPAEGAAAPVSRACR